MTAGPPEDAQRILAALRKIVGARGVLTGDRATRPFRGGYRFGGGAALAVVVPQSLVELWRVAQACVTHEAIIIMQAANTGLTGGSTPYGEGYDRPVVILSTTRLDGIRMLDGGRQVVCLPGATLHGLEKALAAVGREPHSVIGSSCIGASVVGGVCNNSGGALVQRGPAYTEMALYARLEPGGRLRLINTLGIELGNDPEEMLRRLEHGDFAEPLKGENLQARASDDRYQAHVRDIEAATPARYNADPRCLHGASGSAGRLIVFAVRLDTFPQVGDSVVFYLGTNEPAEFTTIRRHILAKFAQLPIAGEYVHREAFDIADRYGKDSFLAVRCLGTQRLPKLFRWKARIDGLPGLEKVFGPGLSDRLLQAVGRLFPDHLPARMRLWRDRFEHHLLLKVSREGADEARAYLASIFTTATGDFFECTAQEADKAFLHRFAVAGAAVRYRAIHRREAAGLVALDFALPRNTLRWHETLPVALERSILHKLYYGHFFCQVFHHDYIVAAGHDVEALDHAMCALLDGRNAEYPAEHNVGHLYAAKPALAAFYRDLDPRNRLNPGIGRTSRAVNWR